MFPRSESRRPRLAHPAAAARRGARSGCGPVAAAECGALGASAAPGRTQPSLSTPGPLRALVGSVPPPHFTPAHLPHPHQQCRPAAPPSAPSPQRARLKALAAQHNPAPASARPTPPSPASPARATASAAPRPSGSGKPS